MEYSAGYIRDWTFVCVRTPLEREKEPFPALRDGLHGPNIIRSTGREILLETNKNSSCNSIT